MEISSNHTYHTPISTALDVQPKQLSSYRQDKSPVSGFLVPFIHHCYRQSTAGD